MAGSTKIHDQIKVLTGEEKQLKASGKNKKYDAIFQPSTIKLLGKQPTFLAGSIWEPPCHVLCFGFFSMNLSRNAASVRSFNGFPLYTILAPERRVWAMVATDGCACEASTVSSHQLTQSALLSQCKTEINKIVGT